MQTSTITTKGQITIPAVYRHFFNLTPGKKVTFLQNSTGIEIRPLYSFKSVAELPAFGMWKNRKDIGDTDAYVKKMRQEAWDTIGRYKSRK